MQRLNLCHNNLTYLPASLSTINHLYYLNASFNKFNFNALEPLIHAPYFTEFLLYAQDTILPIHQNDSLLSVSAGGTLSNNTYNWYINNKKYSTKTGDSTLVIPSGANIIQVSVYNSALNLSLSSAALSIVVPSSVAKSGIKNNASAFTLNENVSIFPNPAHNNISIGLSNIRSSVSAVQIISLDGKMLLEKQISSRFKISNIKINIAQISAGSYYLLLITKDGTISRKFIKQ